MHKLYEFACDELKDLEKKAGDKGLTNAEIEYADKLTELKKNILKIEMLEDESGYSGYYPYMGNMRSEEGSYARGRRGANRDSMGRYSSERGYSRSEDEIIEQLEEMLHKAHDERTKTELRKLIDKMS
jgi:hypothetical protein